MVWPWSLLYGPWSFFYYINWISAHVYRNAILLQTMLKKTGQQVLGAFTVITSTLWKTHFAWARKSETWAVFIDVFSQRLISDYNHNMEFLPTSLPLAQELFRVCILRNKEFTLRWLTGGYYSTVFSSSFISTRHEKRSTHNGDNVRSSHVTHWKQRKIQVVLKMWRLSHPPFITHTPY